MTLEQANADIERMVPMWIDMFPFPGGASARAVYIDAWRVMPAIETLKGDVIGSVGDSLWIVLATIGIVLVIASGNVTNLLLVRGESKAREREVRAALGAGSWRIARALLVESLLLAVVAGVFGVVLAYLLLDLLLVLAPQQLPRLAEIAIDARALTFAALVTLSVGVAISLAPVLRAAQVRLSTGLRAARGASAGRAQHRAQNALVVGQVALALVLLVSSGLMIRTFEALRAIEPGFASPESLQTFRVATPGTLVPNPRDVLVQQRAIVDALEAIPGVSSVGFTNALPMEQVVTGWDGIAIEGQPNDGVGEADGTTHLQHDIAGLPRHDGHPARRRPRLELGRSRGGSYGDVDLGRPRARALAVARRRTRPAHSPAGPPRAVARDRGRRR